MANDFERSIGYSFRDKKLLYSALNHSSHANESHTQSNERLEFLGDAILSAIVSKYLYSKFPKLDEGDLTRLRSQIVCESSLRKTASAIAIGDSLLLGRGEETTGGRKRGSILSDAFEALIAAIMLDSNYEQAEAWVLGHIMPQIAECSKSQSYTDSKTLLQEVLQARDNKRISYRLIGENGPAHSKVFTTNVLWGKAIMGTGTGRSKKLSEQDAALNALKALRERDERSRRNADECL